MFERNGEKLGSILVDGHRNAPSSSPEKAAKKAPAKAESKADEPKTEAKAADEPKQAEKPKSTFKSALDTPKSESSEPARNASTEEWAKFLKSQKIDHPEDAGRDELIELFDKSKKG